MNADQKPIRVNLRTKADPPTPCGRGLGGGVVQLSACPERNRRAGKHGANTCLELSGRLTADSRGGTSPLPTLPRKGGGDHRPITFSLTHDFGSKVNAYAPDPTPHKGRWDQGGC